MNNSKLSIDSMGIEDEQKVDNLPWLRQRVVQLTNIIEAIQSISQSSYWKLLENEVFGGVVDSLNKRLASERDEKEIYRLQGQIVWAKKYSDINSLCEVYQAELLKVNTELNGKK